MTAPRGGRAAVVVAGHGRRSWRGSERAATSCARARTSAQHFHADPAPPLTPPTRAAAVPAEDKAFEEKMASALAGLLPRMKDEETLAANWDAVQATLEDILPQIRDTVEAWCVPRCGWRWWAAGRASGSQPRHRLTYSPHRTSAPPPSPLPAGARASRP